MELVGITLAFRPLPSWMSDVADFCPHKMADAGSFMLNVVALEPSPVAPYKLPRGLLPL